MGQRGPRGKPAALKVLAGTRADRVKGPAAAPAAGRPEAPAWLDLVGRQEWDRIVPILETLGPLSAADGPTLALYCDAHSRLMKARDEIDAAGLVSATDAGAAKGNPAVAAAEKASAFMLKILGEFGGTLAARGRLPAPPEAEPVDAMAEFLKRRADGNGR